MYGKCGFLKDALQLFDEMSHRDLASWASIFTSHNRANLPQKNSLLVFAAASRGNLQPDDFIYVTLFNTCAGYNALKVCSNCTRSLLRRVLQITMLLSLAWLISTRNVGSLIELAVFSIHRQQLHRRQRHHRRRHRPPAHNRSYLRTPASFEECGHGRVKIRGAGGAGGLAGGLEEVF
ncbi:hypothetical protein SASPL_108584 [Salvia splendens]|uniref:Pentatricopeptide repeat-containing protein n=1 Tax=Salvia splendens TaxID=180675 RepID=A0A8X9A8C5_SALSN|nr:hypothetical protein SASPL_108584 [Salvia splendens]